MFDHLLSAIHFSSAPSWPLILLIFALAAFLAYKWYIHPLYRRALHRPIPGIPHHVSSANTILGDLTSFGAHVWSTSQILSWFPSQVTAIGSPIIQVFLRPFGKPWVVIADARESHDILTRRTVEFDRGTTPKDVLGGILPEHHVTMASADPRFKANRSLVNHLMTPKFVEDISAPRIYSAMCSLIDLWAVKAGLAESNPFHLADDFAVATLDAMWMIVFPCEAEESVVHTRYMHLNSAGSGLVSRPEGLDGPVQFETAPIPAAQKSILTLTAGLEGAASSPVSRLYNYVVAKLPYMRRAQAQKEALIKDALKEGLKRFANREKDEEKATCALDDVLYREWAAAEKEGRPPVYDSRAIYDEVSGLLVAGNVAVAVNMSWGLKYFTKRQDVQARLRISLREAFSKAAIESRHPTVREITKTSVPYLDAVQEEVIRCSRTVGGIPRLTLVDAEVLGHRIPKGTNVLMLVNGPDIIAPPVGSVPESLRSANSQASKDHVPLWDPKDIHLFRPERWLKNVDGVETFDPNAGPLLTFGGGPRGCYGRRMAYVELRIMMVLLVWNFEFLPLPEELNSWEAIDKAFRRPKQCFVRLKKI